MTEDMRRIVGAFLMLLGIAWVPNATAQTQKQAQMPVKVAIDWVFQGLHAPLAVAIEKNYFTREGLAVALDRGYGSNDTIAKVAAGTYDFGYADVNVLVQFNHDHPDSKVTCVFLSYDGSQSAIVALKSSGIRQPKDLDGRNIAAPVNNNTRVLFPIFARAAGIDNASVKWTSVSAELRDTLLYQGKVDAVATLPTTTVPALAAFGVPRDRLTVLPYSEYLPELVGAGVLVSRKTIQERPEMVRAFVKGFIAGEQDTIKDPARAMAALARFDSLVDQKIELARFVDNFELTMRNPLLKEKGLGSITPARLKQDVELIASLYGVSPPSDLSEIYTEAFLPPSAERSF